MIGLFDRLARPFLRILDPETAHSLAIRGLSVAPGMTAGPDDSRLRVQAFGLDFPNPVGIAPGFDKHAEVPDALFGLGFGFVEIGTVTPLPQTGNPRPRIFRLEPDGGVINRLGFNSEGEAVVLRAPRSPGEARRHRRRQYRRQQGFARPRRRLRAPDRSVCAGRELCHRERLLAEHAGPAQLQQGSVLDDLLARVVAARDRIVERAGSTPLLLKIAPDLSLTDLDDVVGVARARRIDGMIVGNTTIGRPPSLRDQATAKESGGLSGKPLFPLSTRMLAETYVRAEGAFPLIGSAASTPVRPRSPSSRRAPAWCSSTPR